MRKKRQIGRLFLELVKNIFTSGKTFGRNEDVLPDGMVRYILMNLACVFCALILLGSFIINLHRKLYVDAALCAVAVAALLFIIIYARTKVEQTIPAITTVVSLGLFCILSVLTESSQSIWFILACFIPFFSIMMLGTSRGIIFSAGLLFILIIEFFIKRPLRGLDFVLIFGAFYILILVSIFFVERSRAKRLKLNQKLDSDYAKLSGESLVMKEMMRDGVFLMDRYCVIQPAYSRALEGILLERNLRGRSFLELLSASVSEKKLAAIEDYFDMMMKETFDEQTLVDINPLNEFVYIHNTTSEGKDLRCSFRKIDSESNVFILGIVEDFSEEKELQNLIDKSKRREDDLHALMESIESKPMVLFDFINNADFEFKRIDELLSRADLTPLEIMTSVYLSIYSLRAYAMSAGLGKFSNKLFEMEDVIKELLVNAESENNIYLIVDQLQGIKQDKENFLAMLNRKHSYSSESEDDMPTLVNLLAMAAEKAAADCGKTIHFNFSNFDEDMLAKETKLFIRTILMQLIVNAIVHGIENKGDRKLEGKDSTGNIILSTKRENGKINIFLSDDGRGLDFIRIIAKAQQVNLLQNSSVSKSEVLKVMFSFGFSTANEIDMYSGQGIGLSLVEERLKEIKGNLGLRSENGKNTIFNIYIPDSLQE